MSSSIIILSVSIGLEIFDISFRNSSFDSIAIFGDNLKNIYDIFNQFYQISNLIFVIFLLQPDLGFVNQQGNNLRFRLTIDLINYRLNV